MGSDGEIRECLYKKLADVFYVAKFSPSFFGFAIA